MTEAVQDHMVSTSRKLFLAFQLYRGLPSQPSAPVVIQTTYMSTLHPQQCKGLCLTHLALAMSVCSAAQLCIGKAVILSDSG